MNNQGSGNNGSYTFVDILNILAFILELQNYNMNIDQNDMQNLQSKFNEQLSSAVSDIHRHLKVQDEKIDNILEKLDNLNR